MEWKPIQFEEMELEKTLGLKGWMEAIHELPHTLILKPKTNGGNGDLNTKRTLECIVTLGEKNHGR